MTIQRNWIGRSEGAEILFRVEELDVDIPVFTTRPDTLYGATFFVLAPEHPLVERIATPRSRRVRHADTRRKKTEERAAEQAEDRRLHRPLRDQPGERRAAADLGRRLRADGLRHRRDHGRPRARRARPRVRRDLRPPDRRGDRRGRAAGQLGRVRRPAVPRRRSRRSSRSCAAQGHGRARGLATACATGASAASATGAARSRSSTATTAATVPVPDDQLPRAAARGRGLPRRRGMPPLATQRGVAARRPARGAAARPRARPTRWTRSSTRPGTSCATSTRTTTEAPFDRRARRLLGADRRTTSAGSTTRPATCSTRASS